MRKGSYSEESVRMNSIGMVSTHTKALLPFPTCPFENANRVKTRRGSDTFSPQESHFASNRSEFRRCHIHH